MLYSIYLGFGTLSNLYIADWILRVNGIGDRMCVQHEAENSLAFFCSHIERHGLHTAHTAPRLSIYQIQIYPNAVCAVFVSVCVLECWLQQKRPVETFRSWLKSGELRMLKKKKKRRKYCEQLESERKQRRGPCVWTVEEGFSPTGLEGLRQDGAQVSAGPGKAVISCL